MSHCPGEDAPAKKLKRVYGTDCWRCAASAFIRAFFNRRGKRDLFFLASFGIFWDFAFGAGAGGAAATSGGGGSGAAAFFLAGLSAAFASLTASLAAGFFLSAINLPSTRVAAYGAAVCRGSVLWWHPKP